MAHFDRLQDLWQGQAGPAVSAEEALRMAQSVRAYARRQQGLLAGKALIIAAILAAAFLTGRHSAPTVAGLALVGVAAGLLIFREWRDQRAIERLDFSAPSVGFLRATTRRLLAQRDPGRRYFWPFMGVVVFAMNLTMTGHRIWIRLIASCLPFIGYELGLRLRHMHFEATCRPLIDRLSAMRSALEERAE